MESEARTNPIYIRMRFALLKALTRVMGRVTTPNNGSFRLPRNFHPYDFWGLHRGVYEDAETEILDKEFQPDDLIIEIGSNIGFIARRACAKLRPSGTLVCIEANPAVLPYLEANVAELRGRFDVHVVGAAIGAPETEGENRFFRQRNSLTSGLGEVATEVDGDKSKDILVPVRSLSSVVEAFDKDGKGYSLVCDAEGAEILIFTKDLGSLSRCRQIAIELHEPAMTGSDMTPEDMVQVLEGIGFTHGRVVEKTHYFRRGL